MTDRDGRTRDLDSEETLLRSQLPGGSPDIPRFELLGLLGSGGMGAVYRARDRETGEVVALKVLRPELRGAPELLERFKNELRLARRVTHRHVCRIHELGRSGDLVYITMEYVEGESLRQRLRRAGKVPPQEAIEFLVQVCDGLAEAHRAGITHRDLKPENLMITPAGEAKVLDFGLARSVDPGLTGTGQLLGTPAYMAPEQAESGEVSPATDVYSLGLILYEMLTGAAAIQGESPIEIAMKQVRETPPTPRSVDPAIPPALDRVVMRCLCKQPDERFDDAYELRGKLAQERSHLAPGGEAAPRGRRRPAVVAGALALVSVLAVGLWLWPDSVPAAAERPIEHYRLDSGLQVVLAPDPGAYAVGVSVAYEAGSHVEPAGLEGITHFAEHMLFQGSENVARGEYLLAIDRVGGMRNGGSFGDALVTFSSVPAEQIELALFLEADRMRSPRFDQEVVERERRVVLEEYGDRRAAPWGDLWPTLVDALFAPNPERRGVQGTRESLLAVGAADLERFASSYLTPDRAAVAVTGAFEPAEARRLVEQHFASIPSGSVTPQPPALVWPTADGPRRIETVSGTVPSPLLLLAYQGPRRGNPAYLQVEAAVTALGNGDASRLHRLLVEEHEVATRTAGGVIANQGRLAAPFVLAVLKEGKDPALVESLIEREIERIAREGLDAAAITRVARGQELEIASSLTSPAIAAARLAWDAAIHDDPRLSLDELSALEGLSSEQVALAVREWLIPEHRVTLLALPGAAEEQLPLPPPLPPLPLEAPLERAPIIDTEISVSLPPVRSTRLENGLVVLSLADPSYPLVDLSILVEGAGPLFEPSADLGVARVTGEALTAGPAGVADFEGLLERLGCRVDVATAPPYAGVELRGRGLSRFAPQWIPLIAHTLREPALPADGIGRVQQAVGARAYAMLGDAASVAEAHARRRLYGGHPAGRFVGKTDIEELTPREVAAWYRERYRPDRVAVVVRGALESVDASRATEEAFASWRSAAPRPVLEWPEAGERPAGSVTILDGSPRGIVVLGAQVEPLSHPRHPVVAVLAEVLGQGRLWARVREQQGLAYAVGVNVDKPPFPGVLLVSASTDISSVPEVLDAILGEIDALRTEPVSHDELKRAGGATAGGFALSLRERLPAYLLVQHSQGLSPGYWEAYPKKLQSVSAHEVRSAAVEYLDPESFHLVVGGEAEVLEPLLRDRGFERIEILDFPGL